MLEADLLQEGRPQTEFRLANINGDVARWLPHVDVNLVAHVTRGSNGAKRSAEQLCPTIELACEGQVKAATLPAILGRFAASTLHALEPASIAEDGDR